MLGYTSQGALDATQPIFLAAVAFGLATDYGVFLLSRIKEARDGGASDSDAVAIGLERTGRIVTAAALLFAVAIGAFATSKLVFIKELGSRVRACGSDRRLDHPGPAGAVADGSLGQVELVGTRTVASAARADRPARGHPAGQGLGRHYRIGHNHVPSTPGPWVSVRLAVLTFPDPRPAAVAVPYPRWMEMGHLGARSTVGDQALWVELDRAFGWTDLLLPEREREQLQAIARKTHQRARIVRGRGGPPGATLLFVGERGTGKTMAAQILGADLERPVFQADLPSLRLRDEAEIEHVFAAAEHENAIIVFDTNRPSSVAAAGTDHASAPAIDVTSIVRRCGRHPGLVIFTWIPGEDTHLAIADRAHALVQPMGGVSVRFPLPAARTRVRLWRTELPSSAAPTVTDQFGNPVSGEPVTFGPARRITSFSDRGDGTYTATYTSTTTAGTVTITATDGTLSDHKTLTQNPGPPAHISVQLTPASIVANGSSTSSATGTVTDANGNPIPAATVTFKPAGQFGPVTVNGVNGTYTATYTSTIFAGPVTITATAGSASGQASLNQTAFASATTISAIPSAAVTNQGVTLIAIVTAGGGQAPKGTITFQDNGVAIRGCVEEPLSVDQQLVSQSTCQASLAASAFPHRLTAVFTSSSTNIADSSGTSTVAVGPSSTSTSLDVSNPTLTAGSNATYIAAIEPSHSGPVTPTGSVAFLDAGHTIPACAGQRVTAALGGWLATCTVNYPLPGSHSITARYSGDANFGGSASPPQAVTIQTPAPTVLGTIKATMLWSFFYTPGYTAVRMLLVNGAPVGGAVSVTCQGRGCPFVSRATSIAKTRACKPKKGHECLGREPGVVNLMPGLQHRHLRPGARIIVKITRANWIGKYYRFTIRSAQPPAILTDCLAPGGVSPGAHC